MGELIELDEKRPHLAGEAHCIQCGKEWAFVAPIGTVFLECPDCHVEKGIQKGFVERAGPHWSCNCGNQFFHVTPDGIYCCLCGAWQNIEVPPYG